MLLLKYWFASASLLYGLEYKPQTQNELNHQIICGLT